MSTKREYCGVGKVPKGAVRGSAKQCAEQSQVRYWGLNKIDSRTLAAAKDPTKIKDSEIQLKLQYSAGLGSKKQLEKYIATQEKRVEVGTATETDKKKLSESKKDLVKVNKVLEATKKKILKLDAAKKKAILDITPNQAVKAIPSKDRKQIIADALSRTKKTKKKTLEQIAAYKEAGKAVKVVKKIKTTTVKPKAAAPKTRTKTKTKEVPKPKTVKSRTTPKAPAKTKVVSKSTKSVKPKFNPDSNTYGRPMIVLDPNDNKTLYMQMVENSKGWRKFDREGFTDYKWENVQSIVDYLKKSMNDDSVQRNFDELVAVDEKTLNELIKFAKSNKISLPPSMTNTPNRHILNSKQIRDVILEALKKKASQTQFSDMIEKLPELDESDRLF